MVLATDMCRHFEYLTKFQHTVLNLHEVREESLDSAGVSPDVPDSAPVCLLPSVLLLVPWLSLLSRFLSGNGLA